MGNGKDLINAEKQKISKLLNERISTLEISMGLCSRANWMIKRNSAENITKVRTRNKGKGSKNFSPWKEWKLKWIIVKESFLISA